MRMVFSLVTAVMLATAAQAQSMRPADQERLLDFDANLGRVLRGALAEGAPQDVAILTEVLRGAAGPLEPAGDWQCRTLKLGGGLPLVVYGNFRCRITAAGPDAWRLEKLTGSQRTQGTITAVDQGALYLGVGYVGEAPAAGYDGLPPDDQTPVYPGQTVAVVGAFEQMDRRRARLLQPDPILESDFDILYLTR